MHKYQPRIHIVKRHESNVSAPITDLEVEEYKTFIYPETIFTAVTAYQNQLVSQIMSIDNTIYEAYIFCLFLILEGL